MSETPRRRRNDQMRSSSKRNRAPSPTIDHSKRRYDYHGYPESRLPDKRERDGRGYSFDSRRRDYDPHPQEFTQGSSRGWDEGRDEWNCPECRHWNDETCVHCGRCNQPQPRGRLETRERSRNSSLKRDEEVDEFGRKKGDAANKSTGPRWPPPFDRRNTAYVFDSRSGMFYHASTEFFYDPKTKLYYGNKEKKYYSYFKGETQPFKEFVAGSSTQENKNNEKVENKPKIAISLKTKVLAASVKEDVKKKQEANAHTVQESRVQKEHAVNLDRWSERGREVKGKGQVVRTTTGQPVCLLCKRKFKDLPKLERHENISDMHMKSLSRYSKQENITEEIAASHYRDRAFERRLLHGPEDAPVGLLSTVERSQNTEGNAENALGDGNVGNKMLQKLGWKAGTNLGRNAGARSSDGALQRDWDRIEELAKSGKR